jgi:beta-glucosidase
MSVTRRKLALGAGAAALGGCVRSGEMHMPAPRERQFPGDFLWGVASAAYQIEGAVDVDGRGQSVWDVFPRERIHDRSDAFVANDSYHRYAEDVALIADAGLKAYRFSIAWPRIAPAGAGAVNQAGVDYY